MLRFSILLWLLFSGSYLMAQSTGDLIKKNLENSKIVIPGLKHLKGFGPNEGAPDGDTLLLPKGIRIVQRPNKPFDPNIKLLRGIVNTFYTEISFVNDNIANPKDEQGTGAPVTFFIEPGLVVLNTAPSRIQNGMLMDREPVTVPPTGIGPGGTKEQDTVTIYLGVACINKSMGLPWEENLSGPADTRDYPIRIGSHKPGKIVRHPGLQQLFNLLAGYPKLKLTRHYNPQLIFDDGYEAPEWQKIYDTIQHMVWKVTDGPGITKGELDKFKEELAPYK